MGINMDDVKDLWWVLTIIGGMFVFVATLAVRVYKLIARIERLEDQNATQREDISMILRSQFAVIDGLRANGWNGPVSAMHSELQEYILNHHGKGTT